jgi:hypothetical protein
MQVLSYFQGERNRGKSQNLTHPFKRTSDATGVSETSVKRIKKKIENGETFPADGEMEERRRDSTVPHDIREKIRDRIQELRSCTPRKKVTLRELLAYLQNDGSIQTRSHSPVKMSISTLALLLHKMGYTWRKKGTYYQGIQEKPSVQRQAAIYLRTIEKLRRENRKIYYQDESWCYKNMSMGSSWMHDDDDAEFMKVRGPGQRSIILGVIGPDGIVPSSVKVFRGRSESRKIKDYHSDMNCELFLMWLDHFVLPHIRGSVLVIDRATYHTVPTAETAPPRSNYKKQDFVNYILTRCQQVTTSEEELQKLTRIELKKIAFDNKPIVRYKIVALAETHDVKIVILPVAHPKLNVIEFVWARVKHIVSIDNEQLSLVHVEGQVEMELKRVDGATYNAILREKVIPYELSLREELDRDDSDDDDESCKSSENESDDSDEDSGDDYEL